MCKICLFLSDNSFHTGDVFLYMKELQNKLKELQSKLKEFQSDPIAKFLGLTEKDLFSITTGLTSIP